MYLLSVEEPFLRLAGYPQESFLVVEGRCMEPFLVYLLNMEEPFLRIADHRREPFLVNKESFHVQTAFTKEPFLGNNSLSQEPFLEKDWESGNVRRTFPWYTCFMEGTFPKKIQLLPQEPFLHNSTHPPSTVLQ